MDNNQDKVITELKNKDKNFIGYIELGNKSLLGYSVFVTAISKLSEDEIINIVKNNMNAMEVQVDLEPASIPNHQDVTQGDEVRMLFMGRVKTKNIQRNPEFKIENSDQLAKTKEWYREFRFLSPIIVDKELKVIDGDLRLQIAINSNTEYVSIVVLDTDIVKSKGLRLALNRTSEFQRWNYREVDKYVDSYPQLQPILEPIGFFSNNVLPSSFFSDTVMQYKSDKYNEQQQKYMQDEGLIEWADTMRKRNAKLEKDKNKMQKDYSRHSGLLNIKYTQNDLLDTYNPDDAIHTHLKSVTKMADTITKNFDEIRGKEIEAKGLKWQNTRRSSKEKAKDNRREAEEKEAENDKDEK